MGTKEEEGEREERGRDERKGRKEGAQSAPDPTPLSSCRGRGPAIQLHPSGGRVALASARGGKTDGEKFGGEVKR